MYDCVFMILKRSRSKGPRGREVSILGVVVFLGRGKLLMMEVGGKEAPILMLTIDSNTTNLNSSPLSGYKHNLTHLS